MSCYPDPPCSSPQIREDKVEGALVHDVQLSEGSVVPENLSCEGEHLDIRMDRDPPTDLGLDIPDGVPGVYPFEGDGMVMVMVISAPDHKDFHVKLQVCNLPLLYFSRLNRLEFCWQLNA